jgi:hypothetical protein
LSDFTTFYLELYFPSLRSSTCFPCLTRVANDAGFHTLIVLKSFRVGGRMESRKLNSTNVHENQKTEARVCGITVGMGHDRDA